MASENSGNREGNGGSKRASGEEIRGALAENRIEQLDSEDLKAWLEEKESAIHELEHRLRKQEFDFKTVMEMASQINARSLDSNGLKNFINYIQNTLRGHFGVKVVYLIHPEFLHGGKMKLLGEDEEEGYVLEMERGDPIVQFLKKGKEPVHLDDLIEETGPSPELEVMKDLDVELVLPLIKETPRLGEEIQGVLMLGPKMLDNSYSDSEKQFLTLLGSMIAISLHNAELHQKSITDSLTGLYSRGHFDLELSSEITRMERSPENEEEPHKNQFCVMILDVDHFKEFNDTYGHQTGDRILKTISDRMQENLRKTDVVARYGGEEFGLITPETDPDRGRMIARRLLNVIEETTIKAESGEELSVTVSGGISTYPRNGTEPQELVTKADEALYMAKEQGRNQAIHADSELMSQATD